MSYKWLLLVLALPVLLAVQPLAATWRQEALADEAVTEAPEINIDLLVQAIIQVESDGRANCRGRKGERGLMQIRRATWRWTCKNVLKVNWDFDRFGFDRAKNIAVGRAYLEYLASRLKSQDAVICAYNCGITRYLNNRVPPFTLEYLKRVKALLKELEQKPLSF